MLGSNLSKKILCFVHTEYHLLLFINKLINDRQNGENHNYVLCIPVLPSARIVVDTLNLAPLQVELKYIAEEFHLNKPLSVKSKLAFEELLNLQPDEFIFFQEMDLLMIALCNVWGKEHHTKVSLYQDGLKPYNLLRFNSLGLIKHFHKSNVWLKTNGFQVRSWLSPLWGYRYASGKDIDEVHLTFPEAYINWNSKQLVKIDFIHKNTLEGLLDKVFNWNDEFLPENDKIILMMNQPMGDDGMVEYKFLLNLKEKYPNEKIYIKIHPNTPESAIKRYEEEGFFVIRKKIPGELFIMKLKSSIVISQNSTSMFINNEHCKFYYLHEYFGDSIKRYKRYSIPNHPAPHIKLVQEINQITF